MKYQLVRVYNDLATMTECGEDIVAMLQAAAIYLCDRNCIHLTIDEWDGKFYSKQIMRYERP